jgi:hypothetical protein
MDEALLRAAYHAFNTRDVQAAVRLMHPEVDWPNAWEGGRAVGRDAVREYWNRQSQSMCTRWSMMREPVNFFQILWSGTGIRSKMA